MIFPFADNKLLKNFPPRSRMLIAAAANVLKNVNDAKEISSASDMHVFVMCGDVVFLVLLLLLLRLWEPIE
jgi:hypothetical protein